MTLPNTGGGLSPQGRARAVRALLAPLRRVRPRVLSLVSREVLVNAYEMEQATGDLALGVFLSHASRCVGLRTVRRAYVEYHVFTSYSDRSATDMRRFVYSMRPLIGGS